MDTYDFIILGAGPAGLTAEIYALRYNLKSVVIGALVGGLMTEPKKICNWPGELAISGAELTQKIYDQIKAMNGEVVIDQATSIKRVAGGWQVDTAGKKSFVGRAILLAMGTEHKKLGVAGETELIGRGVAYCATCDAMFYKGRTVAVVGGGNSAMTAALYLADLCPKVYLIYRHPELRGEAAWLEEIKNKPNIIHVKGTEVVGLLGAEKLEKIILNKAVEGSEEVAVEGLFVEIGVKPKTGLFKEAGGEVDEKDRVKVKIDQSTNLNGVWAAGDITDGSNGFRQILTACSEGSIATESAYKFLRSKNN